jgi:hypothetical protein
MLDIPSKPLSRPEYIILTSYPHSHPSLTSILSYNANPSYALTRSTMVFTSNIKTNNADPMTMLHMSSQQSFYCEYIHHTSYPHHDPFLTSYPLNSAYPSQNHPKPIISLLLLHTQRITLNQ